MRPHSASPRSGPQTPPSPDTTHSSLAVAIPAQATPASPPPTQPQQKQQRELQTQMAPRAVLRTFADAVTAEMLVAPPGVTASSTAGFVTTTTVTATTTMTGATTLTSSTAQTLPASTSASSSSSSTCTTSPTTPRAQASLRASTSTTASALADGPILTMKVAFRSPPPSPRGVTAAPAAVAAKSTPGSPRTPRGNALFPVPALPVAATAGGAAAAPPPPPPTPTSLQKRPRPLLAVAPATSVITPPRGPPFAVPPPPPPTGSVVTGVSAGVDVGIGGGSVAFTATATLVGVPSATRLEPLDGNASLLPLAALSATLAAARAGSNTSGEPGTPTAGRAPPPGALDPSAPLAAWPPHAVFPPPLAACLCAADTQGPGLNALKTVRLYAPREVEEGALEVAVAGRTLGHGAAGAQSAHQAGGAAWGGGGDGARRAPTPPASQQKSSATRSRQAEQQYRRQRLPVKATFFVVEPLVRGVPMPVRRLVRAEGDAIVAEDGTPTSVEATAITITTTAPLASSSSGATPAHGASAARAAPAAKPAAGVPQASPGSHVAMRSSAKAITLGGRRAWAGIESDPMRAWGAGSSGVQAPASLVEAGLVEYRPVVSSRDAVEMGLGRSGAT